MFEALSNKYGSEFNWREIENGDFFLNELHSEININSHPLYAKARKAVAKCDSNDDVLFLLDDDNYAIVHLTYSKNNIDGYPTYNVFMNLSSAICHIEELFITEFFTVR